MDGAGNGKFLAAFLARHSHEAGAKFEYEADIFALKDYRGSGVLAPRLAAPTLMDLASDDQTPHDRRTQAIFALGIIGYPEARPLLFRLLEDSDKEIRRAALGAIARPPDPAAQAAILRALADPDPEIREAAVWATEHLGGAAVQAAILAATYDPNWDVRMAAARAAGQFAGEAVIERLLDMLHEPLPEIRRAAAESLGRIGDPQVVLALQALATSDTSPSVRVAAREACRLIQSQIEADSP